MEIKLTFCYLVTLVITGIINAVKSREDDNESLTSLFIPFYNIFSAIKYKKNE